MSIYWLEQSAADLPADDSWLAVAEQVAARRFRFSKRRDEWLLGRWTAKSSISAYLGLPDTWHDLSHIEIRCASTGAPFAFLADEKTCLPISLSHRAGKAICAVTPSAAAFGCDLELVEPRSPEFLSDYFTCDEQALVEQTSSENRDTLLTLLWSGKESALKAMQVGLRADTRSLTVRPLTDIDDVCRLAYPVALLKADRTGHDVEDLAWQPFQVISETGEAFVGWWSTLNTLLRTVVMRAG